MSMASRGKDAAMAANLRTLPGHKAEAVEAHKRRRFNAFMASLSPSLVGTARYRRMLSK